MKNERKENSNIMNSSTNQAQKTTLKFIMLICEKVSHYTYFHHFKSHTHTNTLILILPNKQKFVAILYENYRIELCHDTCENNILLQQINVYGKEFII